MTYLKRIKTSNFKCFSDEVDIELGKLTLLTGANSTGKSSLMYSVLGALQSPRFPYEYSANGRFVNMGSFSEMVFRHDNSLPIGVSFTLVDNGVPIDIETTWEYREYNDQPVLKNYKAHSEDFKISIKPKEDGNETDFILDLDYDPRSILKVHGFEQFMSGLFQVFDTNNLTKKDKDISNKIRDVYKKRTIVKDVLLVANDKGLNCPNDISASVAFGIVDGLIRDAINRYKNKMNFISSYRLAAERIYLEESLTDGKIQASGKGFVNQMLYWRESNRKNYESLINAMRFMKILYDIEPERIGGGQFKIGVTIHKDGPKASLSDVGFGISQLLPIIVGDIELGNESTLFSAQPEIHLHPNAQANYADYLVSQIAQNKNYIVETHSEYLLNRIRLAIVKGQLNEDDIRVYYLSQEHDTTKLYPIVFTKSGQINGAPSDFFETYMIDVMNIAMEAVG